MARLLLEWLNEEVRLTRVVNDLDEDFRDGYLLGELLMRYNQQDDFDQFDIKDTPECKVRNFCLLENTLRRLEIPFNFKLAADVMEGKFGTMKALLSELRSVLDRIKKNSQPPIAPVGQNGLILRVMNPGKTNYDKSMSASFEKSMRVMMENPTEALIKKAVTNKFVAVGKQLNDQSLQAQDNSMQTLQSEKQRQKEIFRHRKKHEGEFAKAWELINIEQWKKNQTRAVNRKDLEARLLANKSQRMEQSREMAMESARSNTFRSIDDFDQRIAKEVFREDPEVAESLGASLKKTIAGVPGTGVPELSYVDKANLQAGLVSTLKKIKEHHDESLIRQQSHDRRRRKFVREREFSQSSNLQSSAESVIVGQLLNKSESENVEIRAQERIMAQKSVISQNRSFRNELVKAIDEKSDSMASSWSLEGASREKDMIIAPRIQSQLQRAQKLHQAQAAAERQRSLEVATEVLERILDLTDWVYSCRQLGLHHISSSLAASTKAQSNTSTTESEDNEIKKDSGCIPAPIWNDAVSIFTSTLESAKMLQLPSAINVFEELPLRHCEQPLCMDQDALLKLPFQTHHVLVLASATPSVTTMSVEGEELVDLTKKETAPLVIQPSDGPIEPERAISEFLSSNDASKLFSTISNAQILGFETVPDNLVAEVFSDERFSTPQWLLVTPPKYLLGEAIVTARCVDDPIPEDGTPVVEFPKLSFRAAICGTSELARRAIGKKLVESISDLKLIRVEELVHEYSKIAQKSKDIERELRDKKQQLSVLLASYVENGIAVPNEIYVSLIEQTICSLPTGSSFVLEDFPNTRAQARLLLEAFSGINYEQKKPQRSDRVSSIAPSRPEVAEMYDTAKCGIDKFIFVEAGNVDDLVEDRIRTRMDLQSGATVRVADSTNSVQFLQELYTPLRPVHTFSVGLHISNSEASALRSFIKDLGRSTFVNIAEFGSIEDVAAFVVGGITTSLSFAKAAPLDAEQVLEPEIHAADEVIAESGSQVPLTDSTALIDSSISTDSSPTPNPVELPKLLATALANMWTNSESQLKVSARECFCSLRDLRYQMLQRRRGVHDVISRMLVRSDERQDLFEAFCSSFNDIPKDYRFDADCIAELHLRTVELGDSIACLSDKRKKGVEEQLQQFLNDGMVQVLVHRSQFEGAAILQSLFNTFSTSVHLLFDISKALSRYEKNGAVSNRLEEALAVTIGESVKSGGKDAKAGAGGKDAKTAKAGKDAPAIAVPFREPIPPILLPSELMNAVPLAKTEVVETAADPKAKGKPADKGKKAEEAAPSDPFEATEKAVLEAVAFWSKGSFTVSRVVYNDNESLCIAIENAIWHEVDRLKLGLETIKVDLVAQTTWLNSMETDLKSTLTMLIDIKHAKELACVSRLQEMIGESIEKAEPIRELWLLAADAISVHPGSLVISPEDDPIVPSQVDFFADKMNPEQVQALVQLIAEIKTGNVALEEDVKGLLRRITSKIGPFGAVQLSEYVFMSSLVLGKKYRTQLQRLQGEIAPHDLIQGIAESYGVVDANSVGVHLQKA